MADLVATTPGLFPLPDRATGEPTDLCSDRAVADRVRSWHVEIQRAAGLDRIVEGQGRWRDALAHPLAVHGSVETGDPVPYYDTGTSYREVTVRDDLGFDGAVAAEMAALAAMTDDSDLLQAVLPGPYSLADLATDERYGDEDEFLAAVGEFLAGEAAALPDAVETLLLLEPSLVTNPPGGGADELASEAIDAVAAATEAAVVVQTTRGALDETVHAHLLDAGVDAVGYDLVSAPEESARLVSEFGTEDDVALGVVDAADRAVESADLVRERVEWFEERTPPVQSFETIYLAPNAELRWLPTDSFTGKVRALGAATGSRETR